jgi:hypothetical protein
LKLEQNKSIPWPQVDSCPQPVAPVFKEKAGVVASFSSFCFVFTPIIVFGAVMLVFTFIAIGYLKLEYNPNTGVVTYALKHQAKYSTLSLRMYEMYGIGVQRL